VKLAALLFAIFISHSTFAQGANSTNSLQLPQAGNPTREFVMSCTYGVLAGTLVGAASLAFADKPSEKLYRVARGASLGLYTGILLGIYVVYVVPSMEDLGEEEDPVAAAEKLPFIVAPRFENDKLAGADLTINVLRF
jgi:hypothetical protein